MRRREFFGVLAAGLALPHAARAQTKTVPVVGFLHPGFREVGSPVFDALRDGLREYGYNENENIKVEPRWANGRPEVLRGLAEELVRLRVDLIVATARPSIEAARSAGANIPIIGNDLESDPVASGFVARLAHPGGNITGQFLDAPELCSKWLQQLRAVLPKLAKVAVLWDITTGTYQRDAIRTAAAVASVDIALAEFREQKISSRRSSARSRTTRRRSSSSDRLWCGKPGRVSGSCCSRAICLEYLSSERTPTAAVSCPTDRI